jgi:oligopeptide transport system substrate-binding protein
MVKILINGKKPITDLGVEAPNATTFVVHLVNADSSFLDKITLPNLGVVSAKNIQKYAKKWTDPSNMVTSGAYKLTQHVVNGYVLASKNPYYYDAQNVAINQVKYFPYIDANSAVAAYKACDLDTTFELLPIEQYKQLKTEFKDQVHTVQLEAMAFYDFNMQDPELGKNLKLRQALSMAVDRDALVNNLFQDGKKPLYSAVTATVSNGQYASLAYPWATWSREKRLAQAKQLYNEAGYSVAKPYKVTMLYTNDMYKKISIALAAMWKDSLGVQVTLQPQDWKTFLQSRHTGQYQIARGGWFADYNNVTTYTLLYKCGSTINDTHWCDSEYNRLISQGDMAVNKAEQYKNYSQALQRVQDAYIVLPLFQLTFDRMVKPYVKNYQLDNNYLDRTQSKWLKFN